MRKLNFKQALSSILVLAVITAFSGITLLGCSQKTKDEIKLLTVKIALEAIIKESDVIITPGVNLTDAKQSPQTVTEPVKNFVIHIINEELESDAKVTDVKLNKDGSCTVTLALGLTTTEVVIPRNKIQYKTT